MNEDKINEIINNKYQEKMQRLENKISHNKRRRKLNYFLALSIVFVPILLLVLFLLIMWGKKQLGWFDTYEGMYKVELPMEPPAKGGTFYIPNDWKFIEEEGWYMIQNDKNEIIAYEVNRGYYQYNSELRKSEWINEEINPKVLEYNYLSLLFECISDGSNNCFVEKNQLYYRISFQSTCTFEDKELKKRNYFKEYFFVKRVDEALLRRIDNSYVWGGIVYIH